jgi:hypothetical protein
MERTDRQPVLLEGTMDIIIIIIYLQGPWILNPLKMGPICCPKTTVGNYHYSLHYNPEECSSHPLRGGSLKSRLTGCYEVWKGNEFTLHLFWVIYFQHRRYSPLCVDCLTLNTKARRSFKRRIPTSNKAWFLISPSPGHNRGIYPIVGQVSLFPAVINPCPLRQSAIHIAKIVSALETDENRDLRLPPRYKPDLPFRGKFTQRRSVVSYRRFGTTYCSYLQGSSSWESLIDEDGTDTFSRNAGN